MLPWMWVGWSICWIKFKSKIIEQNSFEAAEVSVKVHKLISGKLKLPAIITGLVRLDIYQLLKYLLLQWGGIYIKLRNYNRVEEPICTVIASISTGVHNSSQAIQLSTARKSLPSRFSLSSIFILYPLVIPDFSSQPKCGHKYNVKTGSINKPLKVASGIPVKCTNI